jgi:hypothetical protein
VEAATASLPSQETKGVQPYEHHDGVGLLPGSSSEASVAKPPDERVGATSEDFSGAAGDIRSQEPASEMIAPSENKESAPHSVLGIANPETQVQSIDPQGPAPGQVRERGANVEVSDPSNRESSRSYKRVQEDAPKLGDEVATKESALEKEDEREGENDDTAEESPSPKQDEVTPPSQPTGSLTQRKGKPGRSSSDSDAGHRKRASVMNMVKGEMKVLLGKASRNMGKVEEGEKLKHGSV